MKKIIIPLIFLVFNCYASDLDLNDFNMYLNNEESSVYAAIPTKEGVGLIITHDKNIQRHRHLSGEIYFVFLDKSNNILFANSYYFSSASTPVFINDQFISFVAKNLSSYMSDIIIFDFKENQVKEIYSEDKYIASTFIFDSWLYYSTENSDSNTIRMNLTNDLITKYPSFQDQRLAGGYFFIQNNRLYKNCARKIYDVTDEILVKTDLIEVTPDESLRLVDFADGDYSEYMNIVTSFLSGHNY